MYPFHIPELLLCEKVLYKEKKQIFTYQISPFTSFFQNTWCTRLQFAKHCGYKSIMLFELAKDLCHMTLLALRLFHFHVNQLFTFGFFFRGIIRISEILTYMAKIIRFQANFLPLKCLDAKNNKGIYPLSCVISAW